DCGCRGALARETFVCSSHFCRWNVFVCSRGSFSRFGIRRGVASRCFVLAKANHRRLCATSWNLARIQRELCTRKLASLFLQMEMCIARDLYWPDSVCCSLPASAIHGLNLLARCSTVVFSFGLVRTCFTVLPLNYFGSDCI